MYAAHNRCYCMKVMETSSCFSYRLFLDISRLLIHPEIPESLEIFVVPEVSLFSSSLVPTIYRPYQSPKRCLAPTSARSQSLIGTTRLSLNGMAGVQLANLSNHSPGEPTHYTTAGWLPREPSLPRKGPRLIFYRELDTRIVDITVGEDVTKTYQVHKDLLCQKSPFFEASFDGDFQENKESTMRKPDVSPQTFDAFVRPLAL